MTQKAGEETPWSFGVGEDWRSSRSPPRRLDGPVLADGPSDALGQLVAVGLRSARLSL